MYKKIVRKIIQYIKPEGQLWFLATLQDRASIAEYEDFYRKCAEEIRVEFDGAGGILDIGTGAGHFPVEIARRIQNIEIIGIDLSSQMVKIAKRNAKKEKLENRVKFQIKNGSNLEFNNAYFDMVVSTGSLHHWRQPIKVINECYRVLKNGKYFWLYDKCGDASEEEIRPWIEKSRAVKYGWISRLAGRREFKIDAYTIDEASKLIEQTQFKKNYIIKKDNIFMKIILTKISERK